MGYLALAFVVGAAMRQPSNCRRHRRFHDSRHGRIREYFGVDGIRLSDHAPKARVGDLCDGPPELIALALEKTEAHMEFSAAAGQDIPCRAPIVWRRGGRRQIKDRMRR